MPTGPVRSAVLQRVAHVWMLWIQANMQPMSLSASTAQMLAPDQRSVGRLMLVAVAV